MKNAQTMDKDLFVQILRDNKRILYKVISIYCQDKDDRKDLEQEIIIQLWKSLKTFDGNYKLSTWIYKVAINVSISFYRKDVTRKSRTTPITESIFQEFEDRQHDEELNQNRKILHDFINRLSDFNKEIIILYLEDLSYKEIGEIVGISESHVGTKINRIKTVLKNNFNQIKQD